MSYKHCDGTSLDPKRNSIEYVTAGKAHLPMYGRCRHCDKRTVLTLNGLIRAHKDARLMSAKKTVEKLRELGFTPDFVANMMAAAQQFSITSINRDPDENSVVTVRFYAGEYTVTEEESQ